MSKKFRDIILNSVNPNQLKTIGEKLDLIDINISKRIQFLIMVIEKPNLTYEKIAHELGTTRKSLSRWSKSFKQGELESLIGEDYHAIEKLSKNACNYIENWINSGYFINSSPNELVIDLAFTFNEEYSSELISEMVKKVVNNKCKILRISESELKGRILEKNETEFKKSLKESINYYGNKIIDGKNII